MSNLALKIEKVSNGYIVALDYKKFVFETVDSMLQFVKDELTKIKKTKSDYEDEDEEE